MKCHQALSFSTPLIRIPGAEAVFWPGCALLNLDGEIMQRTLDILRRAEPEIRLAAGCCGQPTRYLFPEKAEQRQNKLAARLKQQGVKRIYTACPNCTRQMQAWTGLEVIPIWEVLAAHLTGADIRACGGSFVWHDPCPTRQDPAQQAAARELLRLSGCDWTEPVHTGAHTRCCGNAHMLRAADPEKSAAIRTRRLAELDRERIILSTCEGCLDAFRSEGRETRHLLELLFGKSEKRSWANRIKTTRNAPVG